MNEKRREDDLTLHDLASAFREAEKANRKDHVDILARLHPFEEEAAKREAIHTYAERLADTIVKWSKRVSAIIFFLALLYVIFRFMVWQALGWEDKP